MAKLITAFAVPIITAQLEDHQKLNADLRTLFLECEAEGDKYANPSPYTHRNSALFESAFTLFEWQHAAVSRLREFCMSHLFKSVGELNGFDDATLKRLSVGALESWFHVTRRGGYFGVHNHPLHSWSGVYCVCQEGDEGNADSGLLTFINPFLANTMYVDMATHGMKPPFQLGNIPTRLKPGQLVLFPSWLLHQVSPFEPKDEGLRITVAFNVGFRMAGVEQQHPIRR